MTTVCFWAAAGVTGARASSAAVTTRARTLRAVVSMVDASLEERVEWDILTEP